MYFRTEDKFERTNRATSHNIPSNLISWGKGVPNAYSWGSRVNGYNPNEVHRTFWPVECHSIPGGYSASLPDRNGWRFPIGENYYRVAGEFGGRLIPANISLYLRGGVLKKDDHLRRGNLFPEVLKPSWGVDGILVFVVRSLESMSYRNWKRCSGSKKMRDGKRFELDQEWKMKRRYSSYRDGNFYIGPKLIEKYYPNKLTPETGVYLNAFTANFEIWKKGRVISKINFRNDWVRLVEWLWVRGGISVETLPSYAPSPSDFCSQYQSQENKHGLDRVWITQR